jgi:hypothetical protein
VLHSSTKRFVSVKTFRFEKRLKLWHCCRPLVKTLSKRHVAEAFCGMLQFALHTALHGHACKHGTTDECYTLIRTQKRVWWCCYVRCGLTAAALLLSSNPVHHFACRECFIQKLSD